jgi:hypothetical protein
MKDANVGFETHRRNQQDNKRHESIENGILVHRMDGIF